MDVIYLLGSIGLGWGSSFVHPSAWAVNVNSSAPQVMLTYKVFFCLYPMFRLMWLLLFLQILCHYH